MDGHPFRFRPGTFDEGIFRTVLVANEYRLPEAFRPDDLIVDIGAHIGCFCYAALVRGAGRVYGFEAEPGNFARASEHLAGFAGRVELRNQAVWRSDRAGGRLTFYRCRNAANTGGNNAFLEGEEVAVEAVPFDDVLDEVTRGGRERVRLLKIDCEGSEFPILLTSRRLGLVDRIAGEFHEFGGAFDAYTIPEWARIPGVDRFTIDVLADSLRRAGFAVTWERPPGAKLGIFAAERPSASRTDAGRAGVAAPWWKRLGAWVGKTTG